MGWIPGQSHFDRHARNGHATGSETPYGHMQHDRMRSPKSEVEQRVDLGQ